MEKLEKPETQNNFTVDVTKVTGLINYNKLVQDFGTTLIDQALIDRFVQVTGQPVHPWIRREIFFSHRDLDKFLDAYEKSEPIFIYTGRGPTSDSLHFGHLIPFIFTKWLQDVFNCVVIIQIADDEKFYFKDLSYEQIHEYTMSNVLDILAVGFKPEKTFVFSNFKRRQLNWNYEQFVTQMKKMSSIKTLKQIFGFTDELNVGCYDWVFYQTAAAFSQAFPEFFTKPAHCLIAYAIDQDPYFRFARDIASKMKLLKPCSIISKFIPPLTGIDGKMSSSVGSEASLFLSDSDQVIIKKIKTYGFSGGGGNGTLQEHRLYGGNTNVDISYQYLTYFEYDDEKLEQIKNAFTSGTMGCGEIKKIMWEKLIEIKNIICEQRAKLNLTDKIFQLDLIK